MNRYDVYKMKFSWVDLMSKRDVSCLAARQSYDDLVVARIGEKIACVIQAKDHLKISLSGNKETVTISLPIEGLLDVRLLGGEEAVISPSKFELSRTEVLDAVFKALQIYLLHLYHSVKQRVTNTLFSNTCSYQLLCDAARLTYADFSPIFEVVAHLRDLEISITPLAVVGYPPADFFNSLQHLKSHALVDAKTITALKTLHQQLLEMKSDNLYETVKITLDTCFEGMEGLEVNNPQNIIAPLIIARHFDSLDQTAKQSLLIMFAEVKQPVLFGKVLLQFDFEQLKTLYQFFSGAKSMVQLPVEFEEQLAAMLIVKEYEHTRSSVVAIEYRYDKTIKDISIKSGFFNSHFRSISEGTKTGLQYLCKVGLGLRPGVVSFKPGDALLQVMKKYQKVVPATVEVAAQAGIDCEVVGVPLNK